MMNSEGIDLVDAGNGSLDEYWMEQALTCSFSGVVLLVEDVGLFGG